MKSPPKIFITSRNESMVAWRCTISEKHAHELFCVAVTGSDPRGHHR